MPPIIEWERASLVLASGRPAFLLAFGFGFLFILRGRKSAKDVEAAVPSGNGKNEKEKQGK